MDEAETLGDRIAVLSYGQLKCCGTPLFLKSSLGQGLHLYILKAVETGKVFDNTVTFKLGHEKVCLITYENLLFAYPKTKAHIICTVTVQLFSTFGFAT